MQRKDTVMYINEWSGVCKNEVHRRELVGTSAVATTLRESRNGQQTRLDAVFKRNLPPVKWEKILEY